MRGISSLYENLLGSQEGLGCTELVSCLHMRFEVLMAVSSIALVSCQVITAGTKLPTREHGVL